jgi:hypothetical protein
VGDTEQGSSQPRTYVLQQWVVIKSLV